MELKRLAPDDQAPQGKEPNANRPFGPVRSLGAPVGSRRHSQRVMEQYQQSMRSITRPTGPSGCSSDVSDLLKIILDLHKEVERRNLELCALLRR